MDLVASLIGCSIEILLLCLSVNSFQQYMYAVGKAHKLGWRGSLMQNLFHVVARDPLEPFISSLCFIGVFIVSPLTTLKQQTSLEYNLSLPLITLYIYRTVISWLCPAG